MPDESLTLAEIASIWLPMTIVASLLAAVAYPVCRRLLQTSSPARRAAANLAYALLPPIVTVVAMVVVMHPALSAIVVPAHCHHGACASHAPVFSLEGLGGVSLIAAGSLLLMATGLALVFAVRHGRQRLAVLAAISRPRREWRQIESPDWLAWCCGLWRPDVLLSRGLVEHLSAAELAVVVAHEQAHAERRDNLRAMLVAWATLFWPTPARRAIRRDTADDAEKACDAIAADRAGGRRAVAAVVEALTVRWPGSTATAGAAFGAGDARSRVAALRGAPGTGVARFAMAYALLWCLMLAAMTAATHILVEWVGSLGT